MRSFLQGPERAEVASPQYQPVHDKKYALNNKPRPVHWQHPLNCGRNLAIKQGTQFQKQGFQLSR